MKYLWSELFSKQEKEVEKGLYLPKASHPRPDPLCATAQNFLPSTAACGARGEL